MIASTRRVQSPQSSLILLHGAVLTIQTGGPDLYTSTEDLLNTSLKRPVMRKLLIIHLMAIELYAPIIQAARDMMVGLRNAQKENCHSWLSKMYMV